MSQAEIHQLRKEKVPTNWMCSACGTDASCNCGAPLMSKAQRAREIKAADPERPNKSIARELEMETSDVRDAISRGGSPPPSVSRVIGDDGKSYPTRPRRIVVDDDDDEIAPASPHELRSAFLLYANEAMSMAKYKGPVNEEVLAAARATASEWVRLVKTLENRRK